MRWCTLYYNKALLSKTHNLLTSTKKKKCLKEFSGPTKIICILLQTFDFLHQKIIKIPAVNSNFEFFNLFSHVWQLFSSTLNLCTDST